VIAPRTAERRPKSGVATLDNPSCRARVGDHVVTEVAITDAVDAYLQRKAVGDPNGSGAGAYASNAESILRRWADWLEREHRLTSLFALEVEHMRARTPRNSGAKPLATSTLPRPPGRTTRSSGRSSRGAFAVGSSRRTPPRPTALRPLPTADERPTSDFWTARQRRELERYVRERALDTGQSLHERRSRLREYAMMVAVLAHSTVRGAELFRVPDDDRRTGATWDDVDFYTGTIRVLREVQRLEDVPPLPARADPVAPLPGRPRSAVERLAAVPDGPRAVDRRSRALRAARSGVRRRDDRVPARGRDGDGTRPRALDRAADYYHRRSPVGVAATLRGAGIDVDGDYLTPRGVRRDRSGASYRQESTASKPTLRASVLEHSIVLPDSQSTVVDADPVEGRRVGRRRIK